MDLERVDEHESLKIDRDMRTHVHPVFLIALVVTIVAMLGVITARQYGLALTVNPRSAAAVSAPAAAQPLAGKQLYQSSMHPWIVQDHPGTCPICGMDLVPMSPEAQAQWEHDHAQQAG